MLDCGYLEGESGTVTVLAPIPSLLHMHWRPRSLYFSIRYIRTQARYDYKPRYNIDSSPPKSSIPTPRRLVQFLDEFVVGQENAKKVLSVA